MDKTMQFYFCFCFFYVFLFDKYYKFLGFTPEKNTKSTLGLPNICSSVTFLRVRRIDIEIK